MGKVSKGNIRLLERPPQNSSLNPNQNLLTLLETGQISSQNYGSCLLMGFDPEWIKVKQNQTCATQCLFFSHSRYMLYNYSSLDKEPIKEITRKIKYHDIHVIDEIFGHN